MYKEILIPAGKNLESVVYLLLSYKADGSHVYCDFNGHKLYSDTVTMESAYLEVCGKTKEQVEEDQKKELERAAKREESRKEREQRYKRKVFESNNGEPVEVSMDKVIEGLKYICEHRDVSQEELIDALLELGCNFTLEDVRREIAKTEKEPLTIDKGLHTGDLIAGASVICNVRDSEFGRAYAEDYFLENDNEISIYHFIRVVTKDENYTKENIDNISIKQKTLKKEV